MTDRWSQAAARQDWMVAHRRALHQEPEVGLDLPDTHAYVAEALRGLGLTPTVHPGAGVTVEVPGTTDERPVVLRADMDALPVTERSGVEHPSRRDGAMHACGHDLHMAMLLGAAACLVEQPPRRRTILVFQPGEETDRGAVPTLARHAALALDDAEAFAIHVHATWPAHTVHLRAGTFMAFGDWFRVDYAGPGAHASQPHLAGNPVEAAGELVGRLRRRVAELAADEHLVATVTESLIGNTVNVIPTDGRLRGTTRTLSSGRRETLHRELTDLASATAAEIGVEASTTITEGYPAVVNDAAYVDRVRAAVGGRAELVEMVEPSMVIEDFSYFLQRWPGAMVYLGAQVPGHDAFNHAADAVFDEAVLATGAALHLLAADGLPAT
ncbi:MAG: M20 family metallopeptidase [Nocardioides marinisabuli]|uniref:M20 metallopeptidase family protein n=1 Tax=Nocardioides marinisabuli TaxID=419476 RepID=UPI00321BA3A0